MGSNVTLTGAPSSPKVMTTVFKAATMFIFQQPTITEAKIPLQHLIFSILLIIADIGWRAI